MREAEMNPPALPVQPTPPALACQDLSVGYGSRMVLEGISLEIRAGFWTAVVGPNGSGKSTLLRTLAGLREPRTGSISLQGRRLSAWPRRERARRLAWLAQTPGATELTAAEVVALGRFAHGGWLAHRQAVDDAAMHRAMVATGSLSWARRRLSTLSGGERQRVHLARVLAVEAPVLLLDEPTTHLDPPHQEDVARLLREQAYGGGVCVVSAIHDLSLALAADRLIVLGQQGVIGHGTVREALDGDWLSAAFQTRVNIVDHQGVHLWRPAVPRARPANGASTGLNEGL
ncbi:MAG TPA: ABC transporter ATP-binding protein [Steroidobacteraceae bacterium]|nr:ABC transporter ATP-binding protein [Steroidobacteraceae bacterium]